MRTCQKQNCPYPGSQTIVTQNVELNSKADIKKEAKSSTTNIATLEKRSKNIKNRNRSFYK